MFSPIYLGARILATDGGCEAPLCLLANYHNDSNKKPEQLKTTLHPLLPTRPFQITNLL